jgi:hypothetical protein
LLAGLATEARLIRSRTRTPGAGVPLVWTALEAEGSARIAAAPRVGVATHGGRG